MSHNNHLHLAPFPLIPYRGVCVETARSRAFIENQQMTIDDKSP